MYNFIALSKKSKVQEMSQESQSIGHKTSMVFKGLRVVGSLLFPGLLVPGLLIPIVELLLERGFKSVTEKTSVSEYTPNFILLNHLGGCIVSAPNEGKIREAQEAFNRSDYEIIPDVQLSLPKPTYSEKIYRRRKQIVWPVESGIHQAHSNGITGKGVLVGVIDTGCDADHVQFRQKRIDFRYVPLHYESEGLRDVRGFDIDGHGTHVCGIVAGQHVGIAPEVDLTVASVTESETDQTSLSRILIALDWLLSQFESRRSQEEPIIINMSLGFRPEYLSESEQDTLKGVKNLISALVEDYSILPIIAIGNDGPGNMRAPGYFPEPLSVGAVDFNHKPADFSGGGFSTIDGKAQPDIVGYGVNIFSSLERDGDNRSLYRYMSGTSMATPYVAGIAALCASADTKLRGEALRQHLLNTALPLQSPTDRVGAGLARFTKDGNQNP